LVTFSGADSVMVHSSMAMGINDGQSASAAGTTVAVHCTTLRIVRGHDTLEY
jgi:hypothetical protein